MNFNDHGNGKILAFFCSAGKHIMFNAGTHGLKSLQYDWPVTSHVILLTNSL